MRKKPSAGPLAGDERGVALVDVARQQRGGERVGAGDEHGRHVEHVGGEPSRDERADELARRHEHLAAEVAALLLGRQLVLEVHGRGAGLDHRLHQLERVQRAAEAGLGVGEHRDEPPRRRVALGGVDLVGAEQRVVDAADERRRRVGGVEALVGVHLPGEVRVGGDLPAGDVDRLEAGLHHLHGLAARERAERADEPVAVEQLPQALGAEARERVLDVDGAAQPLHVFLRVGPRDAVDPPVHRPCSSSFGSRRRVSRILVWRIYPDLSDTNAISDPDRQFRIRSEARALGRSYDAAVARRTAIGTASAKPLSSAVRGSESAYGLLAPSSDSAETRISPAPASAPIRAATLTPRPV